MRSALLSTLLLLPVSLAAAERTVEFNRDVRPILSDKCFHCHGPDAVAKKIPLRLDSEAAAKADLGGHRAIVDGDITASVVMQRITAEKQALRMPPVYSGLKLTQEEIATLRTWIAQGARWQKHWSFLPPVRPVVPAGQKAGWARTPLDRFILARLEEDGLSPSVEAGREALIRRVSLDLTGVPPMLEEVDAFVNDAAPDAYDKVITRLLASPRYGERMAARWLDAARYADSNGYQYDGERVMWRWRDWVIDAFNRNQPFDQFTLEQLAGDMLPGATIPQKVATGFNRNHRANTEDGIIPEEYAVEYVVDRVETASTVFLGLTLGCARCHNHKYDPVTQKEFYQIYAYFNNIPELGRAMKYGNSPPVVADPTPQQQAALETLDGKLARAEQALQQQGAALGKAQRHWEAGLRHSPPVFWSPAMAATAAFGMDGEEQAKPVGGTPTYGPGRIGQAAGLDGKSFFDAGDAGAFDIEDRFTLAAWVYADSAPDGSLLTRMADDPKGKGYGVHLNHGRVHVNFTSTWADDAIRIETEEKLDPGKWHHVAVSYTGSRMAEGIQVFLNGRAAKTKVELDSLYRPFRNAGKKFREPFRIGAGWGPERRFRGRIDDVKIFSRVLAEEEIAGLAQGISLNELAAKPKSARSKLDGMQLQRYFLEHAAPANVRELWTQVVRLGEEKQSMERKFPTVMVMAERPEPRETFLLVRGAYNAPGEKVQSGVPAVLPPLPAGAPTNRLGFAKWVVDRQNPLLARVTVNRFWQMYFGTGLVKTTEDFGLQGEWPSHPELLDWLAVEFMDSGWDVKALQRLIVSSAAYRQRSAVTPDLLQRDPDNRLMARGPRLRLPAEMVRDQALFAAGLMTEKIGGASVKPYQPEGLWKEISMQDMDYVESKGADLYRRSLYTFWKRTIAPPMMANFDSALRESCVVRETRTNTPLQALNLMNDVTFLESARALAARMLKEGGASVEDRLTHGFRLLNSRRPTAVELGILRENLQYHLDYFGGKQDGAKLFLAQGESPLDPALQPREVASYAAVASLLLNLDETVTKE